MDFCVIRFWVLSKPVPKKARSHAVNGKIKMSELYKISAHEFSKMS